MPGTIGSSNDYNPGTDPSTSSASAAASSPTAAVDEALNAYMLRQSKWDPTLDTSAPADGSSPGIHNNPAQTPFLRPPLQASDFTQLDFSGTSQTDGTADTSGVSSTDNTDGTSASASASLNNLQSLAIASNPTLSPEAKAQYAGFNQVQQQMLSLAGQITPQPSTALLAQAEFAYYHPSDVDPQSPGAQLLKQMGLTPPPNVDSTVFDQMVANQARVPYEAQVDKQLAAYGEANQSTPEQIAQMKYEMFYAQAYGDQGLPPALQAIQASAQQDAQNNVQKKFGLPAGWSLPSPTVKVIDGQVQGAINVGINAAITQLNLPPDQAASLMALIVKPDPQNSMNAQAMQMRAMVLTEVQKEMGLPNDFQTKMAAPLVTGFQQVAPLGDKMKTALSGLNFAQMALQSIWSHAARIKDPGEKQSTLDLLKVISMALCDAKAMLYTMESQNANEQKEINIGQNEANRAKIEVQANQAAANAAAQKAADEAGNKANSIGSIMKVMAPILIAVAAVATIATGGAAAPLILAAMALTIVDSQVSQMNFVKKLFQAVEDAGLPLGVTILIKAAMILTIAAAAGGPAGAVISLYAASQSGVAQDAAKAIVEDVLNMNSQFTEMIMAIVLNVVIMIVGMKVAAGGVQSAAQDARSLDEQLADAKQEVSDAWSDLTAPSGGVTDTERAAALGRLVSSAMKVVVLTLAQPIEPALKVFREYSKDDTIRAIARSLPPALNVTQSGLGVAQSVYLSKQANIEAGMDIMNADADAKAKALQNEIDSLQAIVQQLQKMLDALVGNVSNISDIQVNLWRSATATN